MTHRMLRMPLAGIEGHRLLALVDEYIGLLEGPRSGADDAMDRLAPNPYPDDAEAAAEYRRSTREDLFDRRVEDARVVRTGLGEFETTGIEAVARECTVLIRPAEVDHWLRTLSGIRLVLARRLGIDGSDEHDAGDPRYGVYDWLGYRLELLVLLADRHDAR
ncbi:DUF2017 family protein [Microbacterium soli]|uniref:DUF2017 domain-containing protein n=1 Tax=Microbacterium soli TaxID=446075 RepID=A0ABP7NFN4_9MICO